MSLTFIVLKQVIGAVGAMILKEIIINRVIRENQDIQVNQDHRVFLALKVLMDIREYMDLQDLLGLQDLKVSTTFLHVCQSTTINEN